MIRDNKVAQIEGMLQSATPESGMQSLDQSLVRSLRDGVVDVDDALSTAEHPDVLKKALQQIEAERAEAQTLIVRVTTNVIDERTMGADK